MFSFLRPFIFSLDPEKAHELAIKSLKYNFLPVNLFSVENEEIEYLKQVFSEDLEFTDPNGNILNKGEFIAGVENIFDLFDNIKFKESPYEDHDNLEIETTYYSNGNVWTSIWSEFSGRGKYTNEIIDFPFHISYQWKGGKIIREVQFFSTKVFDAENEAKSKVLQ